MTDREISSPPTRLSVVVLTFNEARNLPACLEALAGWDVDTFVVDSGSTDGTVTLAAARGAAVASHAFETHARQWRWALDTLPLRSDWVLAIDADQRVTPELRRSIDAVISRPWNADEPAGFFVNRRQIFRGRWIRHGGYYPKYLLKLFRRDAVIVDDFDLVDHHFDVHGRTVRLDGDLIEDNRNEADIEVWIAKHTRYATLQARQELRESAAPRPSSPGGGRDDDDARVRRQKRIWQGLPLLVRPCAYFFYRYILRLGFLDGREGFIFHALQGFWYRLLVDVNILELRARTEDAARQPLPSADPAESRAAK